VVVRVRYGARLYGKKQVLVGPQGDERRPHFVQFQVLPLTGNEPKGVEREAFMPLLQSLPNMRPRLGPLLDVCLKGGGKDC